MTPPVLIHMDLRHHCIETEIRRCRDRLISEYFKFIHLRPRLEPQIALLESVAATWDFASLRSAHPKLAGGCDEAVILDVDEKQRPFLRIGSTEIDPTKGD